MKWHPEVLDKAGHAAARRLTEVDDFYLAGGTGLALRLGHRVSLDLDLFSESNPLGAGERQSLLAAIRASGAVEVLEEKEGTLHLSMGGTSVSLFHYPYPMLGSFEDWDGLPAASLEDIAAMKLSAALGRGAKKDFIDLHELCRRLGVDRVMKAGRRKFPRHRDFPLQAARALVYFEDAEREPMPKMLGPLSWREVKAYFEAAIPKYVRTHLA